MTLTQKKIHCYSTQSPKPIQHTTTTTSVIESTKRVVATIHRYSTQSPEPIQHTTATPVIESTKRVVKKNKKKIKVEKPETKSKKIRLLLKKLGQLQKSQEKQRIELGKKQKEIESVIQRKKAYKKQTPKRPLNAWTAFLKHRYHTLLKEYVGLPPAKLLFHLSKSYREMSDEDRKQFVDLAKNDRERYYRVKAELAKSDGGVIRKLRMRKISGYLVFCRQHFAKLKSMNPQCARTELLVQTSRAWGHLSNEEKAYFKKLAADEISKLE